MKRTIILITMIFMSFAFVSCDFFNTTAAQTTQTETTTISSTEVSTTIETTTVEATTLPETTTEVTITETTTTEVTTTETTTTETTTTETTTIELGTEPFYPSNYSLLQDELEYVGIPSIGSPKVLVFAVTFSDCTDCIVLDIEDINKAFNAESDEIDYESLNSYYKKSSYGKLDLTADVFGYYTASQPASFYENQDEMYWTINPATGDYMYTEEEVPHPDTALINEVLAYYDDQIDYNDYDYNEDGYIDGIYIVYTNPVSYDSGADLWWAYQYNVNQTGATYDGMKPNYYTWSGTEFMIESDDDIDARTIIHESGHMMGLDDYYDYYPGDEYDNSGGLGQADMMDATHGDHGPFSKILLGWVTPLVVTDTATIDILEYATSGEVLLIIDEWNETIFDEYILVCMYTSEGLYEADSGWYFNIDGIMMYHVSAQIDDGYDPNSYYYSIFNYNNTDTEFKVVKYIEPDMDDSVENLGYVEYTDLFVEGDILGDNVYRNYSWYDGTRIYLDIEIIDVAENGATIEITFD